MSFPTNSARAEWAQQTLDYFMDLTGADDYQTALGDLLANCMHLARLGGTGEELSLEAALETAKNHYESEVAEDPDDEEEE